MISEGADEANAGERLKDKLIQDNLNDIASRDPRLATAVSGNGTEKNFNIGTGTAAEANQLGQTWVGDGAIPLKNVPGGLISADGRMVYRPPTDKPNTPSEFNQTGIQANFIRRDPNTGATISNGHLNIK